MENKTIPLHKALAFIICSAMLINGAAFFLLRPFSNWRKSSCDPTALITAIVQTGPEKQALNSDYLAELIGLSIDHPMPARAFRVKQAEEKLLASPVIEMASVKLVHPGIVYIDYTVRKPVALLGDFENVALDTEGYLFPLNPFYSPKNLPEVYLGLEESPLWNAPLEGEKMDLIFQILEIVQAPVICDLFNVKRLDVSNALHESFGKREIVMIAEDRLGECVYPRFLRLSLKGYRQELSNYLKLREKLMEAERKTANISTCCTMPSKVIDFRIPQLAFIDERRE